MIYKMISSVISIIQNLIVNINLIAQIATDKKTYPLNNEVRKRQIDRKQDRKIA